MNVFLNILSVLLKSVGRASVFAFCGLYSVLVFSQSFPVQVIPQVTPPSPIYFANYADASTVSSPLRVQIVLNDFEISNRAIRLRTYFNGGGIAFQSNDVVIGADALFLEGGVPLVLTNAQLAPYFRFENISGISPNVYGNAIPEGAYTFCFEVFDVLTGNRLSQRSCATSVIFQNEPPFLVSPRDEINVEETNPQQIVFQWTPRQINVTNVEYELSIVEIWDTQVDPQAAFLSSPPVFQTTTSATTYVYGPADPLFLSGKNYAWRVQARAKQGIEEIGLFENQGFSEIYSFSYAGSCSLPIGINHEVKGSTNANIFWDDFSTDVPEYTVRYRQKSSSNSPEGGGNEWFMNKTTTNQTTLWDLRAGTIYEYQLQKECAITESDWSFTKQFTTFIADDEDAVYDCNISPDFNLSNSELLPNMGVGDKFTAGDFPITVQIVSGSNGRFTGQGYVTIPYLSSIKVGVQFTNIALNTDKQLIEGEVITMYDPTLSNILDVDDAIDTIEDVVDSTGEFFEGDNDLDEIQVDWTIRSKDDITIEDGMVVITNPYNGVTTKEPLGDDMVITDQEGNTYYVSPEGEITEGGKITPGGEVNPGNVSGVSNNGDLQSLTAENIVVKFNTKGTYGFDKMPEAASTKLKNEYQVIKDVDGNDYALAHHAVKNGGTTQIQATIEIENNAYTPDQVVFKNKQGKIFTPTSINGNTATISLDGVYTFENETIYALVPSKEDADKQLTAGAFTLWHLAEKTIDVAIVSVGASVGDVATAVNGIFGNGLAKINFKNTISVDVSAAQAALGTNGMDVGESPLTAAYNEEQKALRTLAKSAGANDSDTYYVIVLGSEFSNTKAIAGFMPLQRQFGFVFEKYTSNGDEGKGSIANTLAHEIGHGVFALQHPFAQYDTPESSTDWLMDYSNGTNLPHTHWSQMHDPAIRFYVFQDEEDGENIGFKISAIEGLENSSSNTYTFISPSGELVVLDKEKLTEVLFVDGIRSDLVDFDFVQGTLFGFSLNDDSNTAGNSIDDISVLYTYNRNTDTYSSSGNTTYQNVVITDDNKDVAILLQVCSEGFRFSKFEANNVALYDGQPSSIKSFIDFPIKPFEANVEYYEEDQRKLLKQNLSEFSPLPSNNEYDIAVDPINFTQSEVEIIKKYGGECSSYYNSSLTRLAAIATFYRQLYNEFEAKLGLHRLDASYEDLYVLYQETSPSTGDMLLLVDTLTNEFLRYVQSYSENKDNLLNSLTVNSSLADLNSIMVGMTITDYNSIDYLTRLTLIRAYTKNIDAGNSNAIFDAVLDLDPIIRQSETALMTLVTTIPINEQRQFLEDIRIAYPENSNSPSLLFSLLICLDGDNFIRFGSDITKWLLKNSELLETENLLNVIDNNKLLKFSPGFFNNYSNIEWLRNDGKIILGNYPIYYTTDSDEVPQSFNEIREIDFNPYETVTIYVHDDYNFNGLIFKEGTTFQLPAIGLYMIFNKASNDSAYEGTMFAVDVALFAVGVGEINAAIKLASGTQRMVRTTIAVTDMVVGVSDAAINRIFINELSTTAEGQALLKDWNEFMMYYAFARVGYEVQRGAALIYKRLSEKRSLLNLSDESVESMQDIIEQKSGLSPNNTALIDELVGVSNVENGFNNFPKIKEALIQIDPILKSGGFDRLRFEKLLRQSDNLQYLEENSELLIELAEVIKPKMNFADTDILKIFKDAVNSDFVDDLLPIRFDESLKQFGKFENGILVPFSDEQIVTYFKNYHNVHTQGEFFTQIEDILLKNNPHNLTRTEAYTVWGYTTNLFYYELNTCLREGIYLSEAADIITQLKSVLRKVPKYNGTAYRALKFEGQRLNDFLTKYGQKGTEVTYEEFLSCGSKRKRRLFLIGLIKTCRIIMDVIDGPIISDFADGIRFRGYSLDEILLDTGRKFLVEDVYTENGITYLKYKQIN